MTSIAGGGTVEGMDTVTDRADFAAALQRERDLNERQREVLALIASGLTNPQIAERLSLSLDGAKWNVSEVLTKLGFPSREDAAAYYRWRQRPRARVERWVRAAVALPAAAKWVAGGVAAAGVVAGGALLILSLTGSSRQVTRPSEPFRLEATVKVEDRSRTVGTALAPDAFTTNSTISWLYQSNERYRYRIASVSDAEGDRVTEVVSDGTELWTFGDALNSYQRGPLLTWPKERLPNPGLSALVGPAPAKTASEFIAMLILNNSEPNAFGSVTGRDVLLGRPVTVIEFGPTSTGSSSDGVETSSGRGRIWLDEAEMVVLRYDIIESDAASLSMVVTRFDRPLKHGPDTFRFIPPPGAVERSATSITSPGRLVASSGSSSIIGGDGSGGTLAIPDVPGFLKPGHLPPGFRAVGEESSEEDSQMLSRALTFASGAPDDSAGPRITLRERIRSGGVPDSAKTPEVLRLRGTDAFIRRNGGTITITWAENGHVVSLAGVGVPENELLAVAEGLTP